MDHCFLSASHAHPCSKNRCVLSLSSVARNHRIGWGEKSTDNGTGGGTEEDQAAVEGAERRAAQQDSRDVAQARFFAWVPTSRPFRRTQTRTEQPKAVPIMVLVQTMTGMETDLTMAAAAPTSAKQGENYGLVPLGPSLPRPELLDWSPPGVNGRGAATPLLHYLDGMLTIFRFNGDTESRCGAALSQLCAVQLGSLCAEEAVGQHCSLGCGLQARRGREPCSFARQTQCCSCFRRRRAQAKAETSQGAMWHWRMHGVAYSIFHTVAGCANGVTLQQFSIVRADCRTLGHLRAT